MANLVHVHMMNSNPCQAEETHQSESVIPANENISDDLEGVLERALYELLSEPAEPIDLKGQDLN